MKNLVANVTKRWMHHIAGRTLKNPTTIEVVREGGEGAEGIIKILTYLQWCGSVGHSCGLVDPDGDYGSLIDGKWHPKSIGGFDGDGADYIDSIKVNGTKSPRWKEKP